MKRKSANRQKISQKLISLIVLSAVVVLVSLKMYQAFKVDLLMQDLRQLEQEKRNLVNLTEQLQAEVERLSNIDRITEIAKKDYGMIVNTDEIAVIVLESEEELDGIRRGFADRHKTQEELNLAGVK